MSKLKIVGIKKVSRYRKSNFLTTILLIYIYIPFVWNILENVFGITAIYRYILYAILIVVAFFCVAYINTKTFGFLLCFLLGVLLNYICVSYKHYVFIEGSQAFLGIAIPCICIVNRWFNLDMFINKWWKFAQYNWPLLFLSVILMRMQIVTYSIFTGICVPNVFILSYMLLAGSKKNHIIYAIVNILFIAVLGGRMAAIVSLVMFLFAFIYSKSIKRWKKIGLIGLLLSSSYLVICNINMLLFWINNIFEKCNIHSRSVSLLINQLSSKEIYVTGRDNIYSACFEYVKTRGGMPGLFGVPLYLTSGQYYYAHNILLQLLVFFGIWGTIVIFAIMIVRFYKLKRITTKECRIFLWFMSGSYILIGLTGSSIWIHYLSTIFIVTFFFGNSHLYHTFEKKNSL